MALSDSQIRTAKPRTKRYRLSDGGGLVMDVTPAGSKVWRYRLQTDGKDRTVTLGQWPAMSLLDARQAALDLKRQGADPALAQARQRAAQAVTFQSVTEAYMAREQPHWAPGHYKRFRNRMTGDVWPILGGMHPRDIQPVDAIRAVQPISNRGAQDTAVRVLGMIGQVLRYAVARGQADRDVTADLRGGMDRPPPVRHMAAVTDRAGVGELLRDLWAWPGGSYGKTIHQLCAYTFQRPGEICAMRWADIDLDAALWTYRVGKVDIDHAVPLSYQVVDILRAMDTHALPFVFYSRTASAGHTSTVISSKIADKLGWRGRHTAHGWRATARTRIAEDLGTDPRIIEQQLSHTVPEAHGRAYNRTLHLSERRQMMQDYADLLDGLRNVIPDKVT
ncbi:tyrosine-type recombinase/integrase [Ruegeria atlantica]|uniref:Putative prophage CPS-53 integrase n=1 Tax=Ruegeria atlantica TaxID=81569 RepID=A0A0P1EFP7_9RHOB|nr:integrase arm-type DNA-binding domain-containing protein [Ruegeria atlantica]CUH48949.1 Putative prophage CPS-53 integrase [Ruegeria atlantica]